MRQLFISIFFLVLIANVCAQNNRAKDQWYIVYHRRPLGETDANHRVTCIDEMQFDENGLIKPVKITFEGVKKQTLK